MKKREYIKEMKERLNIKAVDNRMIINQSKPIKSFYYNDDDTTTVTIDMTVFCN